MKLQSPLNLNTPGVVVGQLFGGHARDYSPLLGHPGTDIYAPLNCPVYAMCDSYIFESKETTDGYGKHIKLWYEENGRRFVIPYGHFNKRIYPDIPAGFSTQFIPRGTLIGYAGTTGFSNANHVHIGKYEYVNNQVINQDNGYGGGLNLEPDLFGEEFKINMNLVNENGTFYLEGEKGKIGIADLPFLTALKSITDQEVKRQAQGPQVKVVETAANTFIIKDN